MKSTPLEVLKVAVEFVNQVAIIISNVLTNTIITLNIYSKRKSYTFYADPFVN